MLWIAKFGEAAGCSKSAGCKARGRRKTGKRTAPVCGAAKGSIRSLGEAAYYDVREDFPTTEQRRSRTFSAA
ncbi:MAG: hypothetical protein ACOYXR_08485 [Nitrospirota bacterium]